MCVCVCADKFIFHFLFGDRVRIGHKSMPTLDTLNEIVLIVHKTRAALASHPLKAHSGRQKIIFFLRSSILLVQPVLIYNFAIIVRGDEKFAHRFQFTPAHR